MSDLFLPMQLIYEGKPLQCLSQDISSPDNFNLTFSPNLSSNEDEVIEHLERVVFSFNVEKRKELSLPDKQKVSQYFAIMTKPLKLTENGLAKPFLKWKFQE